ncbi:hypothetical protein [Pseudorhodobacter sp. MZDSW-24AT]|uniref:hypothetical protein n=1 Tax=Pseudorhodobacter sp. MZDSW-24AT TaxID=2052957 RepID=UPI000C1EBCD0|nr:hypothetical protein [Pseudorhodobacter sp. MZDSW-24AT]PJF09199.1 hypothetical protein CUR21_12235 [Pseudorhodobacter sp. MZDSW-24AT]
MRDSCVTADESSAPIPISDIARSRADFPAARITFHLELVCQGLGGLAALCEVLDRAGLGLRALRVSEGGRVSCLLQDDPAADLTGLAVRLPQVAVLVSWQTQIAF